MKLYCIIYIVKFVYLLVAKEYFPLENEYSHLHLYVLERNITYCAILLSLLLSCN